MRAGLNRGFGRVALLRGLPHLAVLHHKPSHRPESALPLTSKYAAAGSSARTANWMERLSSAYGAELASQYRTWSDRPRSERVRDNRTLMALSLSQLDGNGVRLNGIDGNDFSGHSVAGAGASTATASTI